jgi:Sulfotransferase domain
MSAEATAEVREPWTVPLDDPPCPEGWVTGPPDFVGVGAQRCGTTWWYRGAIRTHPKVIREAKPGKELHFFDRFFDGQAPGDVAERYARQFPRPADAMTGEWTPRYMHDFWTPPLLKRCAPEARILVMLRDPVERYRSGVLREQRLAAERGTDLRLAVIGDAIQRSLYADQLERLLELFGTKQVLVLQYERCLADPLAQMRRTQSFLGLEPLDEAPARLVKESSSGAKPDLPADLRESLVERMREDVARTAGLCAELDLALWPNFTELAGGAR